MKALLALEAEQSPTSALLMRGEEEELANLVERLDKASTAYQEDQADDKQHQWHQHRDQSEWTKA